MKDFRKVYPFPPRNMEKEEFYQNKADEKLQKALVKKPGLKEYSIILATIVGSLILMISVLSLNSKKDLRSRASEKEISFYLYPKTVTLDLNRETLLSSKLNAGTGSKIASVMTTVAFNSTQLRFDKFQLLAIAKPGISYQSNTVSDANNEGKIKILLTPQKSGDFMTGIIDLPQLQLTRIKKGTTGVTFIVQESKVVFSNGSTATIITDKPTVISDN